jgi:AcrR family transcriptional regulator
VTSRAQILAAARRLIDRDGWEKLTVRQLAAELGVGTTTLYHHVRSKQDLLLLLIREYADRVPLPDLPSDPRERIVVATAAIHDALAAWPWAAEILTADGFVVRVGDSALRLVEAIVEGAVAGGCTPAQAVYVFRSLWYYTVGEILVRARSAGRPPEDVRPVDRDDFFADLSTTRFPHLTSLGGEWVTLSARDTYLQGLRAFVDGLLARATSTTP